jgi:hypothetical protein
VDIDGGGMKIYICNLKLPATCTCQVIYVAPEAIVGVEDRLCGVGMKIRTPTCCATIFKIEDCEYSECKEVI